MKEEPCEDIEQSKFGGCSDNNFHRRTVASLEAERTTFGCGKATPRTWLPLMLDTTIWRSLESVHTHHLHGPPKKRKAYIHSFSYEARVLLSSIGMQMRAGREEKVPSVEDTYDTLIEQNSAGSFRDDHH